MTRQTDRVPDYPKLYRIIIGIGMLLAAAIALVQFIRGEVKFFYQAQFVEFFVCAGPDPATGSPQEPVSTVPLTAATLYACGYLQADGVTPIDFLLFYEAKSTGWLDPTERYRTGYVFREIPRARWEKPGRYRVEAWLNRQKLAAAEFTVMP